MSDEEQLRALGGCPHCHAAFQHLAEPPELAFPTLRKLFPRALLEMEELMVWALKGKHAAEPWRTNTIEYLKDKANRHLRREDAGPHFDHESLKRSVVHFGTRSLMIVEKMLGGGTPPR